MRQEIALQRRQSLQNVVIVGVVRNGCSWWRVLEPRVDYITY